MIQTKKSLNRFLLMSAVFISSLLSGCENSVAQDDSPLQISFKNSSSSSLQNLLVGDIVIGDLAPENISKRYGFTSFTFDTGMPDEDASAFIGGKLYTNHHRGYWPMVFSANVIDLWMPTHFGKNDDGCVIYQGHAIRVCSRLQLLH